MVHEICQVDHGICSRRSNMGCNSGDFVMEQELRDKLEKLELRLEKIELQQQMLLDKLSRHIDFIDETYEGLRNPINAAKRFLGR